MSSRYVAAAIALVALGLVVAQKQLIRPHTAAAAAIAAPATLLYGPSPGFDRPDAQLLGKAQKTIDMAAYVLSDHGVIAALSEAAGRGVAIRLYLDPEQFKRVGARRDDLLALLNQPHVAAKLKSESGDLMHLKSYAVDGRFLRSGSANFSWSGLTRQDNDLLIFDDPAAAAAFTAQFETLWARGDNRNLP